VLQCAAVRCSVLQFVAVRCSALNPSITAPDTSRARSSAPYTSAAPAHAAWQRSTCMHHLVLLRLPHLQSLHAEVGAQYSLVSLPTSQHTPSHTYVLRHVKWTPRHCIQAQRRAQQTRHSATLKTHSHSHTATSPYRLTATQPYKHTEDIQKQVDSSTRHLAGDAYRGAMCCVFYSELQCVAVCCSVLQCVAVCCSA